MPIKVCRKSFACCERKAAWSTTARRAAHKTALTRSLQRRPNRQQTRNGLPKVATEGREQPRGEASQKLKAVLCRPPEQQELCGEVREDYRHRRSCRLDSPDRSSPSTPLPPQPAAAASPAGPALKRTPREYRTKSACCWRGPAASPPTAASLSTCRIRPHS